MKKITFAILLLSTATISFAQKTAHIEMDSLLAMMPETKTAKEVAQKYYQDLEKTVMSMDNEFQAKYNAYLSEGQGMSDLVKKTKEEELQSMQNRIQDFKQQAQMDYQKKSAELTAPIMEKAKKGIDAAAKEGGYKYVLDTSTGYVLYADPADDILLAAKKKLDAMPLANIPGANTNTEKPKATPEKPKTGAK